MDVAAVTALAQVLGAAGLLAWVGACVGIRFARRPPRLSADRAWRGGWPSHPPAVAAMLVEAWQLPPRAMTATVLDLGARGYLEVVEDTTNAWVRPMPAPAPELADHERVVVDHVIRCSRGQVGMPRPRPGGWMSLGALASCPEKQLAELRSAYRDAVHRQASELRLSTPRAGLGTRGLLRLARFPLGIAASSLIMVPMQRPGEVIRLLVFGSLLAWPLGLLVNPLKRPTATPAGRRAAATWLAVRDAQAALVPTTPTPHDRGPAYALALGLPVRPEVDLVLDGSRPKAVRSPFGGRWRWVTVRRARRVGDGTSPRTALWFLLPAVVLLPVSLVALTVLGIGLVTDEPVRFDLPAPVQVPVEILAEPGSPLGFAMDLIGLTTVFLLFGWLPLLAAVRGGWDLARPPVIRVGQVVEVVHHVGRSGDRSFYLATDDGTTDKLTAFEVEYRVYQPVHRGATVRLTHTRKLRHVRLMEVLDRPPTPDDYLPAISTTTDDH